MQSRFAWLLAGLGIAAAAGARFFRRAAPEPEPRSDTRADDLRRRIAESRALVDERDTFEEAETPVDQADPDARRRHVHERGRAAVERMRGDTDAG